MPNLLTSQINLQSISSDQSQQNIFKVNTPAVQTDSIQVFSIKTTAGVAKVVDLPLITKIQSIALKSTVPFDISLVDVLGVPQYTKCPSTVFLFMNPVGFTFSNLTVLSTVAAEIEVTISALYS
jgi:hypothetical protein